MPNKIQYSTKKQLDKLKKTLQKIQNAEITTIDAANVMGISTRTFNRWMLEAKVRRPVGARNLQDAAAAKSKLIKQEAAQHVLNGTYTIAKAATLAACSERTVKRYMDAARGA